MLSSLTQFVDHHLIRDRIGLRAAFAKRLPPSLAAGAREAGFRQLVRYVGEKSPFYRRRFREAGIDVRALKRPEDMGDFFTTAQDLRDNPIEDFLCDRPELGFETTGTTASTGKRVYFSRREVAKLGRDGALGLYNLGLRKEDRVVDGFDYAFWNAPFTLRAAIDRLGCFQVTAAKIPPAEFFDRVPRYNCNVLFVEPSWLVVLTEIVRARGGWPTPLKFICIGGENMSEQTRHWMEGIWGTKVYVSYGQTETFGQIGAECQMQRGYHIDDLNLYCEILDAGEDGYGELVYSTLDRQVMPLVRYRSTDITKFIDEPCTCDLKLTRRLAKIRGRLDEMVNCGVGFNLTPWTCEQLIEEVPGITRDWQVGVRRGENRDALEFRLELQPGASGDEAIAGIKAHLRDHFPDAWRNLEIGLWECYFKFHAPGELRTGRKLRRLVDERMKAWDQ